jgi:antirestriction protein ArdC
MSATMRADIYARVADKIVNDLERGVRPWLKPWNAEHTGLAPIQSGRLRPDG